MRILFCGDRNWTNYKVICDVMAGLDPDVVIEGEAHGADLLAADAAEYFGIPVVRFPADWKTYGRAAGPIRNTQMLKEGNPDMVLAFHDDIQNSKGTRNMVDQSEKQGISVKVYNSKGEAYYESSRLF
jgi:YspA, cpYpsA-related SLOG family